MIYNKDFARYYIAFQDNLSENDKITLLNFVNEANDKQLSHLLYTGYMTEALSIPELRQKLQGEYNDFRREMIKKMKALGPKQDKEINAVYKKFQPKIDKALADGNFKLNKQLVDQRATEYGKIIANNKKLGAEINAELAAKGKKLMAQFEKAKSQTLSGKMKGFGQKVADTKVVKKLGKGIDKLQSDPALQKKVGIKAGSIVVAAAIAAASYAVYKRYLSQAARACSNKKGSVKTLCMQQYRKKATQARIANMKKGMSEKCKATKDPRKCQEKVMSTVKRLQNKI